MLLRIAVLAFLVACGWLLGTATGLADEDEDRGSSWAREIPAQGPSAGEEAAPEGSSGALVASTLRNKIKINKMLLDDDDRVLLDGRVLLDKVMPAAEVLPRPQVVLPEARTASTPRPVPELVVTVTRPVLAAVVEPALAAVVEPTLDSIAPARGGPARVTAGAEPAVSPAPVAAPAEAGPVAPPPPRRDEDSRTTPPPSPHTVAVPDVNRFAGPLPPGGDLVTPSVPATPLGPAPPSCPTSQGGSSLTAPGSPGGILEDAPSRADPAVLPHGLYAGAGGLPRWLSEQPSTSPD